MQNNNLKLDLKNKITNSDYQFFETHLEKYKSNNDILKECCIQQKPLLYYFCLYLGYNSAHYKEYYEKLYPVNKKLVLAIQHLFNKKEIIITINTGIESEILNNQVFQYSIKELRNLLNKGLVNFSRFLTDASPNYIQELELYGYTKNPLTPILLENIPLTIGLKSPIKIVVFSDSHNLYPTLPAGDILICCGDYAVNQKYDKDFFQYMKSQPHTYKILIPGNHDPPDLQSTENIIVLNNETISLSFGESKTIKIHGIPSIPFRKNSSNNSYSCMRRDMHYLYKDIPANLDILVTHFPAWGVGDYNTDISRALPYESGDYCLRKFLADSINLKYHFCGHSHGMSGIYGFKEKGLISINAAQHIYEVNV